MITCDTEKLIIAYNYFKNNQAKTLRLAISNQIKYESSAICLSPPLIVITVIIIILQYLILSRTIFVLFICFHIFKNQLAFEIRRN